MTKTLLFVTGTRADFGKIEPLAIKARDAGYSVSFWVTGMHMLNKYGLTKLEVERVEGVGIFEFKNQKETDSLDEIHANTVIGFSQFIARQKPDLVFIHGDRIEALSCSLVCATNNLASVHIEGGEISGTIDEIFRHCNTKLAHCHFVSSETARNRILRMGEEDKRIHVIGSPELDFHAKKSGVSIKEVKSRYDIKFDDYGICTYHPVTSEASDMGKQALALFEALKCSGRKFVTILPNNDPGFEEIWRVIETLPKNQFRILPSMRFSYFSELMKNSSVIVGNSSAGVREAPFLGIPSLDIGSRQRARSTSASVTNSQPYDSEKILNFLKNSWGNSFPRDESFGTGKTADKFLKILNSAAFWENDIQKIFNE